MQISYTIQSPNDIYMSTATIQVVIERPLMATSPPKFSQPSYQFGISEHLKPNSLARNVEITIYESDQLSVYSSGFFVELLNKDFTSIAGMFEMVPKFGKGTLVASLKLATSALLDYESGKTEYNLIVRTIKIYY